MIGCVAFQCQSVAVLLRQVAPVFQVLEGHGGARGPGTIDQDLAAGVQGRLGLHKLTQCVWVQFMLRGELRDRVVQGGFFE